MWACLGARAEQKGGALLFFFAPVGFCLPTPLPYLPYTYLPTCCLCCPAPSALHTPTHTLPAPTLLYLRTPRRQPPDGHCWPHRGGNTAGGFRRGDCAAKVRQHISAVLHNGWDDGKATLGRRLRCASYFKGMQHLFAGVASRRARSLRARLRASRFFAAGALPPGSHCCGGCGRPATLLLSQELAAPANATGEPARRYLLWCGLPCARTSAAIHWRGVSKPVNVERKPDTVSTCCGASVSPLKDDGSQTSLLYSLRKLLYGT